jgi:predicted lipoprotein with Yx(FWY)xxD motif
MKHSTVTKLLFAAVSILIVGCGGSGSSPSTYGSTTGSTGTHLVDSNGRTVFEYTTDSTNVSTCTDTNGCYGAWPEVPNTVTVLSSDGTAASGVISSFSRTNPTETSPQLTYNGMPLYYFVDNTTNSTTGNDDTVGSGEFVVVSP